MESGIGRGSCAVCASATAARSSTNEGHSHNFSDPSKLCLTSDSLPELASLVLLRFLAFFFFSFFAFFSDFFFFFFTRFCR